MSTSTAIGKVSASLRQLLLGEMQLPLDVKVSILAPDESDGAPRVNLFLYKVQENGVLRNMDWQVKPGDTSQLIPPPLSLNLYYLMTPYAENDEADGNATAHGILGEAMRVFYEFPIVPEKYLENDLKTAREQIKIIQNGLDMEELSQVWSTFSEPFRLSVLYEVTVVQIDMSPARERPLPKRVREIGKTEVEAPFHPPTVERVDPVQGTAGTTLTFHGHHLTGWSAYVSVLREQLLEGEELTDDTFQATLPGDLDPGFYEIRVDISNLFRRTFLFEVTSGT